MPEERTAPIAPPTLNESWPRRFSAWLWGYDYFISYHWDSGGAYATALAERLRDRGYSVFLDRAEFAMGEEWKLMAERALTRTRKLVLVATPAATKSDPVAHEIQFFRSGKRHFIPVVFFEPSSNGPKSTLAELNHSEYPVLGQMPESHLYIKDDLDNLSRGPQKEVVESLIRTYRVIRRRNIRAVILGALALILVVFALSAGISALIAGWQRDGAKSAEAREKLDRQLAEGERDKARTQRDRADSNAAESDRRTDLSRLREAGALFESNRVQSAKNTLNVVPLSNRCVAWSLLNREFEGGVMTLRGHVGPVSNVAVSGYGATLATVGLDGIVRVLDARTGEFISELPKQRDTVAAIAVTPDGTSVAIGSADNTVRTWESRTGRQLSEFKEESSGSYRVIVALAPDASLMAIRGRDGTIRVRSVRTGQILVELQHDGLLVTRLKLSQDGTFLAATAEGAMPRSKIALIWDVRSAQEPRTLKPRTLDLKEHPGEVLAVAFVANDVRILVGAERGPSQLWDVKTNRAVAELNGAEYARSGTFSSDGTRVITGSMDGIARVWNAETGRLEHELKGHDGAVSTVTFSDDGSLAVTGSEDWTARVWDVRTGKSCAELRGPRPKALKGAIGWLEPIRVSRNGSRLVAGLAGSVNLGLWDARSGRLLADLCSNAEVRSVAFSADETRAITGHTDGWMRAWDALTGRLLNKCKPHNGAVNAIAASKDGAWAVTCASGDKSARVWDTQCGKAVPLDEEHPDEVTAVSLSADETRLVTGCANGTARLWHWEQTKKTWKVLLWDWEQTEKTWKALLTLKGHVGAVTSVVFSADGTRVATGSQGMENGRLVGTVRLWDAKNGEEIAALKSVPFEVAALAFSPRSDLLAILSGGRLARVWEARLDGAVRELAGHSDNVTAVAFSADGTRVVTGSRDGTARLWDSRTGQPVAELKGHSTGVVSVWASPDGDRMLTASEDSVRVWDTGSRVSDSLRGHTNSVSVMVVAADGNRVVTGSEDKTARVWDAHTGELRSVLRGHKDSVRRVALNKDGSRVATWSSDGTTKVWEADGQPVSDLKGKLEAVTKLAVSIDGSRVVTTDQSGTSRVWNADTGEGIPRAAIPLVPPSNIRTSDGEFEYRLIAYQVYRIPTRLPDEERVRRHWMTRPDPDWHVQRRKDLQREGNAYGAAVHRWAEARARFILAFEAGDLYRTAAYLLLAARLKPPAPPIPPPNKTAPAESK